VISAATGHGLDALEATLFRAIPAVPSVEKDAAAAPDVQPPETIAAHRVYRPGGERSFDVERGSGGALRVTGAAVERLIVRHDLDNPDALRYIEERLAAMGVIRALEAAGFRPGDDVEIAGTVFELDPGAPLR
jgi:GTP-binding protein